MSDTKRTVLITGCSDGGLGAALAIAFHRAGLHVYASARNSAKMRELAAMGIETLTLDVVDDQSIATCVRSFTSLDILVNNAGASHSMPISDLDINAAKKTFDLNVWSYLAVSQAFLPLLLASKGMIVNQTSVASVITLPFQSVYNASKAAMAMFSDTLRLELEPFGVTVVQLKTGGVVSNIFENQPAVQAVLPKNSMYMPAKEAVEKTMSGAIFMDKREPADVWAGHVVTDLLKKTPPSTIWRGNQAGTARIGSMMPFGVLESMTKKITGVDVVAKAVQK